MTWRAAVAGRGHHKVVAGIAAAAVGSAVGIPVWSAAPAAAYSVTTQSNLTYATESDGTADHLDAYVTKAGTAAPTPAVIFVHGGAWNGGDKSEWATYATDLVTATGWPAFSINYDMNEAYPFVTEYWDVMGAIAWVKTHAKTYNIDPTRIGLVGDSAGGQLAALAAYANSTNSAYQVKALVSWSGIYDLPAVVKDAGCVSTACSATLASQYLGWAVEYNLMKSFESAYPGAWQGASPVDRVQAGGPPTLLVGSANELVPLDQLNGMASELVSDGIPVSTTVYPGSKHALGYAATAWPSTQAYLEQYLTS